MPSLKQIRLDVDAMDQGVWSTFYTDPKTKKSIQVKIISSSSVAFSRCISKMTKARAQDIKRLGGNLPAEEIENIQREAIGSVLIADWSGIEEDDGTPIPFSREKAIEFMTDRTYTEFYEWVSNVAADRERYRQETVINASKNSLSASTGS